MHEEWSVDGWRGYRTVGSEIAAITVQIRGLWHYVEHLGSVLY